MHRNGSRLLITGVALVALASVQPTAPAAAVDTDVAISTSSISFGNVAVGNSAARSVTITNTGGDPFGPINIFGGAPPTAEFGASQNCQGTTLPAGGSCSVNFTFSPSANGTFTDTSSFTISETASQSDGEDFSVTLTGHGGTPIVSVPGGPIATLVVDPGGGSATTTAPSATTTTTTTTATTTTTTATDTTAPTNPATTDAGSAAAPGTGPIGPNASALPGAIVVVAGPLSDGGNAQVIAQGVVAFAEGSFGWEQQLLEVSAAPFTYQQTPAAFFASNGPTALLNTIGGGSSALLDNGEATFVPAGAGGALSALVPGGPAAAQRIVVAASSEPFSFVPGSGNRDVNLIRGVLDPGDTLHVVSPFPVLVVVLDGVVLDAPEGTELTAGTVRNLNDADLSNASQAPATVLIAAVGGQVP